MKSSMQTDGIAKMLERLGKAVSSGDLAGVSACYAFPAFFMSDENTFVFEDAEQVERMFGKGREWYISQGIETTEAELLNVDQLTDKIAAVDVRWPGFDKNGNENHTEISHYIVQADDGDPRIRVALTRRQV